MPTYEYVCRSCGHQFEKFQSMKDEPVKACPKCRRRQAKRKIGMGAGIIFKGSGFYETDYKKPSRQKKEGAEGKSEGDSSSKSEGKSEGSSESKSSKDTGSGDSSGGSEKNKT